MGIIRGQLVLRFRDREALILFRRAATKDFEFGRAYYVKSPAVLEKSQVAFSTFASGMEHNNAASAALDTGFSRCISRVGLLSANAIVDGFFWIRCGMDVWSSLGRFQVFPGIISGGVGSLLALMGFKVNVFSFTRWYLLIFVLGIQKSTTALSCAKIKGLTLC